MDLKSFVRGRTTILNIVGTWLSTLKLCIGDCWDTSRLCDLGAPAPIPLLVLVHTNYTIYERQKILRHKACSQKSAAHPKGHYASLCEKPMCIMRILKKRGGIVPSIITENTKQVKCFMIGSIRYRGVHGKLRWTKFTLHQVIESDCDITCLWPLSRMGETTCETCAS